MKIRHGYAVFDAQVAEMQASGSDTGDLVPISRELSTAVADGDNDPVFVTMNIATEGTSRNGRYYSRETIQSMADQINAEVTDGHNGHLTTKERATKRPHPVALWLGARVIEKDGKAYLYAKAYILPTEPKLRTYLRKAKAVGKNVAVSVFGKAEEAVYDRTRKAYNLVNFMLESIDFARSKSEGIPNDGTLILASEMVNENEEEPTVKREEVIKSLKAEELNTHNPELVAEMQQAIIDNQGVVVSEMEAITGLVGDNPAVAIAEMQRENRELHLDQALTDKVKIRGARPALREMVIAEMESNEDPATINVAEMVDAVLGSDEGRAVIATHRERTPAVNPMLDNRESVGKRAFTTLTRRKK